MAPPPQPPTFIPMRILLHSHFPAGHAYPMQAIAQVIVQRGHEVVWLTNAENEVRVREVGATFVPTQEIAMIDAPLMAKGETGILDEDYSKQQGRLTAQVKDYRRVLRLFPADVLLVDVMPYGAQALYELGELPAYATLGVIPMYMSVSLAPQPVSGGMPPTTGLAHLKNAIRHLFRQWVELPMHLRPVLNKERKELGLKALPFGEPPECNMYSPLLHIQASSPMLEFRLKPKPEEQRNSTHYVGPLVSVVKVDRSQLPPWWHEVVQHPRVVGITQGTLNMDPDSLIIPAIKALGVDPTLLLVVTSPYPDAIQARIGNLSNVRVAYWLPYHLFLPQLILLVTNGGYGSITQALSHKVPLICAGQREDKKDTAARVAWAGVGIDLKTERPSEQEIRIAARRVGSDKGLKMRVGSMGDGLNELGGARMAGELLERLVLATTKHK
ncbi:Fc.00g027790.m01.CDS01 [Cosmosporella sp. VM-42]